MSLLRPTNPNLLRKVNMAAFEDRLNMFCTPPLRSGRTGLRRRIDLVERAATGSQFEYER